MDQAPPLMLTKRDYFIAHALTGMSPPDVYSFSEEFAKKLISNIDIILKLIEEQK